MALTKTQKQKIVVDLKDKIARQKAMIFVDFTGLKVRDIFDLREKLKKINSGLKVAKKTLLKLVFKEKGLEIDMEKLKGQIALIFSFEDMIPSAKTLYQFAKVNPSLKILGGYLENEFKPAEQVIELAELPAREELLAKLVGSLQSPISGFVNALGGNIKGLINVLAKAKI